MFRRYQWWSLLLLNLNVIHTCSNWLCWKAREKFQVEFRFCKTIGCSYITLLTTYLAKKTMFKVSDRNTKKRCLLISKITSERRHLTTSYLLELTVQNHVRTVFPTTLDKTCWDKSWKSSKFKKWLHFSKSNLSPLPPYINVESGQVLLSNTWNIGNTIDLGGERFFHSKIDFLFCLNSFAQDCIISCFLLFSWWLTEIF